MVYNADSGLYLTNYRAYDPVAGRWLSRDPIGESSDPAANLYAYVGGNSLSLVDPTGKNPALAAPFVIACPVCLAIIGGAAVAIVVINQMSDSKSGKAPEDAKPPAKKPSVTPPVIPPGWKGDTAPYPGWVWKGPDAPGGKRGGWVSPDGDQSLHPDLDHKPPIGPHVDWNDPSGGRWRIFPDGTCVPKK
jgi:RHS repeat-associated protein